jgi:hypothetical protein
MGTNARLYDQDFYAWIAEQVRLLKARQFDALDLDNLIDEVESLASQERHLLHHRLETLLTHLVTWWEQIPQRCVRWEHVIARQRYELQDILADSPSLADVALEELADAWAWVRERSQQEWPYAQFPPGCPWTLAQLLDAEFWPALDTFAAREKEPDDAARASLDVDRS